MSKSKYTTERILAQVVGAIIGTGVVFGAIYIGCRIMSALLALAGVA